METSIKKIEIKGLYLLSQCFIKS